jgi:hypothetical protein
MTSTPISPGRFSRRGEGGVIVTPLGSLTAAGNTTFVANNSDRLLLAVTTSAVGTNVIVTLVGHLGDPNAWFGIGTAATITFSGNSGFHFTDLACPFIGARLVSITGGTPTVTFSLAQS